MMAIDQSNLQTEPSKHKRTTYGTGLIRGLQITLRHMLSRTVTVQYPDEQDPLPPRSRGVIALKTENCTVCMLCAKECPDWCIYIDGHKESRQPAVAGKRAKSYNVLDRFAIDYALCMYCGICVEVCPYDALFWSPEFEYAEYDVTELTHEMERLNDWMYTVLPPPALDEKALGPVLKSAVAPAAPASAPAVPPAAPASAPAVPPAAVAVAQAPSAPAAPAAVAVALAPKTDDSPTHVPPGPSGLVDSPGQSATAAPSAPQTETETETQTETHTETETQTETQPEAPAEPKDEPAALVGVSAEEARVIGQAVYEAEMAKGSDPRVAEGRRKSAEARAIKGTKGPQ